MQAFKNIGRNLIIPGLALFLALPSVHAQNNNQVSGLSIRTQKSAKGADSTFISGVIRLASTKAPIGGITLSVPGYSAAITDDKGRFRIPVSSTHEVILISGEGFQSKQVALKGRHKLSILLYEEPFNSTYDVATLPFGLVPRNHIPYSVQSLNLDDRWARTTTETPESYLQGRVSGMNVIRHSGAPGDGSMVSINGLNSLYATTQPLIVVDGMIYDNKEYGKSLISGHQYNPLSDIDIKDIDNITILKSGNSTYGTKGANGVILITTARANELATRIDFAAYGGFNSRADDLPVMQAEDYRTYLSELLQSSGKTQTEIAKLPYMNDSKNSPNYFRYHYNTDWQKQVLRNSYNQNYYLKVTGGDNIAKYGLSLGYLKDEGTLDNTDLTRLQVRFNADLNLTKKLTAAVNLSLVSNQEDVQNQGGSDGLSPLTLSLAKSPFLPVRVVGDDGKVSPNLSDYDMFNLSNPVALTTNMQGTNKNYRFSGSVKFVYQLSKAIQLQTLFGATFDKLQEDMFIPSAGVVPDTLMKAVVFNRSGSNLERYYSLFNDTRFSYEKTFNRVHHLLFNAGFRYNHNKSEQEYGLGYNSATDEFVSVGMGIPALRDIGGDIGTWNWLNTYLHADYSFLNKYFVSANMAMDGSSRFGNQAQDGFKVGKNKFAANPSLALAWLVSSENFFSNINFIENLKLRASISRVGNDDIGNYTARQYYISQNLLGMEGIVRGNIGNPQLQWESTDKMNLGIDAALFHERLNINFDYFHNKVSNMITLEPTISASGFDYVLTNNSAMENNGVELNVNGRVIDKTFKWDLGFNISTYKNKVTAIPNGSQETSFGGATYITAIGGAANLFYGYKTNGVFSSEAEAAASGLVNQGSDGSTSAFHGGDIRFVDKNGDHIINDADREVIGNPNPKFTGGFNNTFTYKRWTLDALLTFSKGNDVFDYTRMQLESMSGYENQSLAVNNRWRADGQITSMPRVAFGDPSGNARFSDRWIEDGSYLRLRTVSLTYNIPVKKSVLKYAKIYATGNNLFTWTKYLGFDPEFAATNSVFGQGVDLGMAPVFRTVQLGVRLGF